MVDRLGIDDHRQVRLPTAQALARDDCGNFVTGQAELAEGRGPLELADTQPLQSERVRRNAHWRLAVWGLRVMAPGLVVGIVGLVTLPWSTTTGKTILAVGIGVFAAGLMFTLVAILRVYGEVRPPRPKYLRVQQTLLRDAWPGRMYVAEGATLSEPR
jgi:hypothetical protein